jgi:hypothetical protein
MSAHALVAVMDATLLDIDIYQQSVLMGLANCAAEDGTNAWPSVATLAERGRMSERKARDALRALEAANIIRTTSMSAGRATTVYAINMALLAAHKGNLRPSGAGPVDFDTPSPRVARSVDDGRADDTQPGTPCRVEARQPGTTRRQPGTPRHSTRHRVPPNLLEPVRTSARVGQVSPSARSPSPASGRADRDRKPESTPKLREAQIPVDPAAAKRWANLQRAVLNRKVERLFRAWVNGASVRAVRICEATGAGVIELASTFHASRVRSAGGLPSLLDELGWRVEVSGAGG